MKNILIGVGMLVLAFYMLWEQGKKQQEYMEENRPQETDFCREIRRFE
jgi:hypothetical protein